MARGVKTGGRQKGTPNKINAVAKDAIALAADELGGADRIVAWAKEDPLNERAFWTQIYPKLIPVQISGDEENPLSFVHLVELVAPKT
jgi:hypothetical protein